MTDTMKALVLNGPNEFEIQRIPVPEPLPHEVLCRVKSVAICGSDPGFISGKTAGVWPPTYPFVIGHEWAGVVEQVGSAVTLWKPGDRVVGEAHHGCGLCRNCKEGKYNLCLNYNNAETEHRHYGHKDTGAYAEYGVFFERSLTRLPENLSFDLGSVIDAAGTALHVSELTGITPGGTVGIIGPGPIGLMIAKVAKSFGASRVVMIGRGERLKIAREIVADVCINFESENVVQRITEITEETMCDEVFECSGAPETLQQAIEIVKRGGSVGMVGIPAPGTREQIDNKAIIIKEIKLHGSRANPNTTVKLVSMLAGGVLNFEDIITHRFPLDAFSTALSTFLNRSTGALKVIVNP